jgi:methylated-DNA-[protein]-cysteine S-methyltransferase
MPISFVRSLPQPIPQYRYRLVETAWGLVAFACCDSVVTRLLLPVSSRSVADKAIKRWCPTARLDEDLLQDLHQQIVAYFAGRSFHFDCRVDLSWAGEFGQAVLRCCSRIKPGQTLSYGRLARLAGNANAARAVGNIMAANRVPLIIPCHRVIATDGRLGGFSAQGGIRLKKRLLEHESPKHAT